MRHLVALNCFVLVYFGGPDYSNSGTRSAFADPKPEDRTVAPLLESSEIIRHQGVKGLWFPMPTARRLLRDLHIGRGAIKLGRKLELRIETEIAKTRLTEHQLASAISELQIWKDTAKEQAKQLHEIGSPPWYMRPYLWAAVGFLIGAGCTVGIVWSIDR